MITDPWAETLVSQVEKLRKDAPFSKIEIVITVHASQIKKFDLLQHKKFCFGGDFDEVL